MNNSLPRLIEGIIATLRADVIPHIAEDYARGQAVGVIDLLNNLAPRLDWAGAPLVAAVAARKEALAAARTALGERPGPEEDPAFDPAALLAERDRLDREITDLTLRLMRAPVALPGVESALSLLRGHLHADLKAEMQMTRRPLFAEIASGADTRATGGPAQ